MIEIADVFRCFADDYLSAHGASMLASHRRAITDIMACRTEALGGHLWRCDACSTEVKRPWRDRSTLERMGELRDKTIGVMVRLPVWDKGERRERDGPADSTGRFGARRMACDQLTDHLCGPSRRVL